MSANRLALLRAVVEEKFPSRPIRQSRRRAMGCEALDGGLGGLKTGCVTEICGSTGGGQILFSAILDAAVRESFYVGLVDGAGAFHPSDWSAPQLARLLWVMCKNASDAVRAADLLLRDGNLPVLILDLQGAEGLRKIPASTWHRFHRVAEQTDIVLVALTPAPLVEGAASRIAVKMPAGLEAMLEERPKLLQSLVAHAFERGASSIEPVARVA